MAKNKQEKPDLISRQELLQVISDHTAKLGGSAPLQVATLAWVKQLVLAMPAKAVLVDAVPAAGQDTVQVPAQAWQAAMDYIRSMHPCTECRHMGDMDKVLAECLAAQCVCDDCLNVGCPCHYCTAESGEMWEWRHGHECAQ